jgi:hypothetical protein
MWWATWVIITCSHTLSESSFPSHLHLHTSFASQEGHTWVPTCLPSKDTNIQSAANGPHDDILHMFKENVEFQIDSKFRMHVNQNVTKKDTHKHGPDPPVRISIFGAPQMLSAMSYNCTGENVKYQIEYKVWKHLKISICVPYILDRYPSILLRASTRE